MTDELKPCPFCGGDARAFYCEESGTFDVQCQKCGAIPFIGSRTSEMKSLDAVIVAWNTRAAVTDEQFAMAVHNGRAERTCRIVEDEEGRSSCSECGAAYLCMYEASYCPNCGAKVVG